MVEGMLDDICLKISYIAPLVGPTAPNPANEGNGSFKKTTN